MQVGLDTCTDCVGKDKSGIDPFFELLVKALTKEEIVLIEQSIGCTWYGSIIAHDGESMSDFNRKVADLIATIKKIDSKLSKENYKRFK